MVRGSARTGRIREIVIGAAAAVAGAGLLCLAAPIVAASLLETPGNPVLKRLHREAAGVPALRRLIRSREASLDWREKGRTWTDLALARMVLGERGAVAERDVQFALAEDALIEGLALAPMNPYGWMRLVRVRMAGGRPAGEIAPALSLALNSGPREDRMLMLMVEAGLHAWRGLDGHDRALVAGKVRQAWSLDALQTAAVATRVGQAPLLARLVGLDTASCHDATGAARRNRKSTWIGFPSGPLLRLNRPASANPRPARNAATSPASACPS